VTWARDLADYAPTDPKYPERAHKGVDGRTTYSEGVNVGYRWFDKEKIDPLFAFGHGLSYAKFDYAGIKVDRATDGGLDVTVTIRNTGGMEGDEVPQVYLGQPSEMPPGIQFPVRALVAFDRVHIAPGQSRAVKLHVAQRQLQYWSTADARWIRPNGSRVVSVGGSSRDLRLSQTVN